MTKQERKEIESIVNEIFQELEILDKSAITGSFQDFGYHKQSIKIILEKLKSM